MVFEEANVEPELGRGSVERYEVTVQSGAEHRAFHGADHQPGESGAIERRWQTTTRLVQQFIDATGLDPEMVGLFAGALAYTRYGWLKRAVMKRIVASEGGNTDTSRDHEYTDWDAVDDFAADVYALAAARAAAG